MTQTPDTPVVPAPDASSPKPPRKRRIWLWALLIIMLLLGGGRGWLAYRGHVELKRYRAAGHPTTLAEYQAKYPTPPAPARNGWEAVIEACNYIQEPDEQQAGLIPFLNDDPVPSSGQPWPAEVREATERYLAKNAQAMELGRQGLEADYFLRPFEPWKGFDGFAGTELEPFRKLLVLYRLEHAIHREQWPAERQIQAVRRGVRMGNVTGDDPSVIGMLVAITTRAQVLTQCQWVIETGHPTPAQLDELDRLLVDMRQWQPGVRAIEGESLCLLPLMEDPSALLSQRRPAWRLMSNWLGLSDANRAAYLRIQRKSLDAFSQPDLRQMLEDARAVDEEADKLGSVAFMASTCLSSSSALARQTAGLAVRIDAARTAIAVERYRLDHRAYPSTLEDLVPAYLKDLPTDPFAAQPGTPLRYRMLPHSYVIYSVGFDGQDDGGVRSPAENSDRYDLVFEVHTAESDVSTMPSTRLQAAQTQESSHDAGQ